VAELRQLPVASSQTGSSSPTNLTTEVSRPPHLVMGGGEHPAQLGARRGAAHGDMDVGASRFCGSTAAKYCTS
jgi:hypothetical protein